MQNRILTRFCENSLSIFFSSVFFSLFYLSFSRPGDELSVGRLESRFCKKESLVMIGDLCRVALVHLSARPSFLRNFIAARVYQCPRQDKLDLNLFTIDISLLDVADHNSLLLSDSSG